MISWWLLRSFNNPSANDILGGIWPAVLATVSIIFWLTGTHIGSWYTHEPYNAGEPLGRPRQSGQHDPSGALYWDDFTDHLPIEIS